MSRISRINYLGKQCRPRRSGSRVVTQKRLQVVAQDGRVTFSVPLTFRVDWSRIVSGLLSSGKIKVMKRSVGMDINTPQLSAVELVAGGESVKLVVVNSVKVKPFLISDEVDRAIIQRQLVKDLGTKEFGFNSRNVVTCSDPQSEIVKKITLPEMPEDELRQSIHWESEGYIPFDIKEVEIDVRIFGNHQSQTTDDQMDVMLAAIKKDEILRLRNLFADNYDLHSITSVAEALMAVTMFNYPEVKDQLVLIVNWYDTGCELLIANKGTLVFYRSDLRGAVETYEDKLYFVEQSLSLFRATEVNCIINQAFICGDLNRGASNTEAVFGPRALMTLPNSNIQAARILDPFYRLHLVGHEKQYVDLPERYAVAFGLALIGLGY